MTSNRSTSHRQSGKIAFCSLMIALSVVVMISGGLIPVATYCTPMICGILLLPVLLEFGKKAAWTSFAAVSLISLFLGFDKEAAFFYLFLGYYPILKWDIDKSKNKGFRLFMKLAVFNVSIILMYTVLGFLLNMDTLVEEFTQMGSVLLVIFIILLNLCLLLYDRLLFPMVYLYVKKIRPRFRFILR